MELLGISEHAATWIVKFSFNIMHDDERYVIKEEPEFTQSDIDWFKPQTILYGSENLNVRT